MDRIWTVNGPQMSRIRHSVHNVSRIWTANEPKEQGVNPEVNQKVA